MKKVGWRADRITFAFFLLPSAFPPPRACCLVCLRYSEGPQSNVRFTRILWIYWVAVVPR
jgi:hypothetical protein